MRINIFYQYVIGALLIIAVGSFMLWKRADTVLKESFVNKAFTFLHDKNINKMKEIDAKIDYYLLFSKDIYSLLIKNRENFKIKNLSSDVVGADLYLNTNGNFSLRSTYVDSDYLKNRRLRDDFFSEMVGQNPLNFAALEYSSVIIQRLPSDDKKTDLLAIVSRVKSSDQVNYGPYYLVLYVDMKRLTSLFTYDPEYSQYLFEPIGGLMYGPYFDFEDVNQYPPFKALLAQGSSVLKSTYQVDARSEIYYFSVVKSNYGYYVATEAPQSSLYAPVYLLKANYSKGIGIMATLLIALFTILAINTKAKIKKIDHQLELYVNHRLANEQTTSGVLQDEFDYVSHMVRKTFALLGIVHNRETMIQKFAHTKAAEKMQFKGFNLHGLRSDALLLKIKLDIADFSADNFSSQMKFQQRRSLFSEIEKLLKASGGVLISVENDTFTYAFGLYEEDMNIFLRGMEAAFTLNQFLNLQIDHPMFGLADYRISMSFGEIVSESLMLANTQTLSLVGLPVKELDSLIQLPVDPDNRLVASGSVKELGGEYFRFVERTDKEQSKHSRQVFNGVYFLTDKIKDYTEQVYSKVSGENL